MEFAFAADVHLTEYENDRSIEFDGKMLPSKTVSIFECLVELGQYTRKNVQSKTIVLGGDLVDRKTIEYCSSINLWKDFFQLFSDLNFIIITGNHDVSDRSNTSYNWINVFSDYKNIQIVDYNEFMAIDNILFCSYSPKMVDKLREAVEKYSDCDVLISHFDVQEARLSNNVTNIGKIRFKDLAQKFKLILLGDYHLPQELNINNSKLIYVGSVIQKTWGEANEEKRFLHCNITKDTYTIKSVPFTKYSKHIKIIVKNIQELQEKKKMLEQEIANGNYARLIFELDSDISKKEIKEIEKQIQKIDVPVTLVQDSKSESNVETINIKSSNKDKLVEFLKIQGIENVDDYMNPIKEFV